MNVTCPQCASVFRVDPAKVPEHGVRARCSVCGGLIGVRRPPVASPVIPPAEVVRVASSIMPPPPPPPSVEAAAPPFIVDAAMTFEPAVAADEPETGEPMPELPSEPLEPIAPTIAFETVVPVAPPSVPFAAMPVEVPAPMTPPPAPAIDVTAARPSGPRFNNPFLQQDPATRARRLARALVSDLVVYHPEKRQRGLADGTLKELFSEEIRKSWEEYSEQVGEELATTTPWFTEALNEILAEGRPLFG
jgi:predicted Zn finger-like uncharacterized protein